MKQEIVTQNKPNPIAASTQPSSIIDSSLSASLLTPAAREERREKKRLEERQPVRGRFKFYEVEGGLLEFTFHKYKGDPIESFSLLDGCIYTIPLGVARHLNNNCWYPVHEHTQDIHGKPSMSIGKKIRRCGFESLEFLEDESLKEVPENLVTVNYVKTIKSY